jgi:hypothetical protein
MLRKHLVVIETFPEMGCYKNCTETFGDEPLNAELNPVCHLLALLGDRHILHVLKIGVKLRLFSKPQKNIMKYK